MNDQPKNDPSQESNDSNPVHEHGQCHSLLAYLSDFVDGTLDESLCHEITSHMANCSNCRIVVDTLRKTVSLYQSTDDFPPGLPDQVRQRLLRKLDLADYVDRNPADNH